MEQIKWENFQEQYIEIQDRSDSLFQLKSSIPKKSYIYLKMKDLMEIVDRYQDERCYINEVL